MIKCVNAYSQFTTYIVEKLSKACFSSRMSLIIIINGTKFADFGYFLETGKLYPTCMFDTNSLFSINSLLRRMNRCGNNSISKTKNWKKSENSLRKRKVNMKMIRKVTARKAWNDRTPAASLSSRLSCNLSVKLLNEITVITLVIYDFTAKTFPYPIVTFKCIFHHTFAYYGFTTKFSPILIGLNWSRDAIVFVRGETLSAHSARPRKIPGWIVVVRWKSSWQLYAIL